MLNAFKDLLCSKLCWHDRPGPNLGVMYIVKALILYSCTRRSSEVECNQCVYACTCKNCPVCEKLCAAM